jgi:fatty acid-binding protein DegV
MFSVMHAAAPDVAQEIVERLRAEFGGAAGGGALNIWVADMVPAIITHAGPGAVAVGFFV